jgi:hypothetical protein
MFRSYVCKGRRKERKREGYKEEGRMWGERNLEESKC